MRKSICVIAAILAITGIGSATLTLNRTDYRPQEECFLCEKTDNSILPLYSKVNGIGILSFNDFSICTLRICNEEPDMSMSGSSHTMNASRENGSIISIDSNLNRRIADVKISLRQGSKPDQKEMRRFLCADCCKQIEQENKYDIAFIDYKTREIFPIKENTIEFYIGDNAIHKLNTENDLEYLVFYAPEQ